MWHELWKRKQRGIKYSRKLQEKAATTTTSKISQLFENLDIRLRMQIAEFQIEQEHHDCMIKYWQYIRLGGDISQLELGDGPVMLSR